MGCCLSKKQEVASSPSSLPQVSATSTSVSSSKIAAHKCTIKTQSQSAVKVEPEAKIEKRVAQEEQAKKGREQDGSVKKEIFFIKHRKSHDRERSSPPQTNSANGSASSGEETAQSADVNAVHSNNGIVRTSSCTKEEVDAILIQCGRLSRSNSSGKTASSSRKYSGSKRSYDFDHDNDNDAVGTADVRSKREGIDCDDEEEAAEGRQHRQRQRPTSRSSSQGRTRTPSRERDQKQQRSGSRERASTSSSGRRVSRSPGRRSENTQQATPNPAARPGKMVSVPATVSSLAMDKSNNCGETNTVKRISVKRNVGEPATMGPRGAASPRSQSPARAHPNANASKGSHENQQPSLSRSSSRKAEQSPYRRNPLSEIDPNSLAYPHSAANKGLKDSTNVIDQATIHKQNVESGNRTCANLKVGNVGVVDNKCTSKEQLVMEEAKAQPPMVANVTVTPVAESLKPQTITRSRSSRLSRDLDVNPEAVTNPNTSYTALLLEDIQNFHQKNIPPPPSFSLPACVSKACSILEAVADLNSTTSSNLSTTFSEDRKAHQTHQSNNKDPFVESEVAATNDLMEPSFHKYVTVTRGGGDMEEQESSGSNSFAGGSAGPHWGLSSSSWEPNSADSTDRWASSRSNTREDERSALGLPKPASFSELARKTVDETRRESPAGRGRIGSSKPLHTVPVAVGSAASM